VKRHRELLALAAFALLLAPLLEVRPDGERVGVRGGGPTLPPSCGSRAVLGVDCPGCGLTRSFVHLAHGDPAASVRSHRLGWLLALLAAVQIPYRLAVLWAGHCPPLVAAVGTWTGRVLLALLLLNWLLKLAGV
jgi:hypothetical protein